jgi:branched-chain amino acid transport system substrate-binding protein
VINEPVSRRKFLKVGGAIAGGIVLGQPAVSALASTLSENSRPGPARRSFSSPKTINVYLLAPLTGALAPYGPGQAQAFVNAVDWLNRLGGIQSMGRAKLNVIVKDTESTPSVAADAVQEAAEDSSVAGVFGCNQSGAALVAAQVALQNQVPFITSSDIDPRISTVGQGWAFQIPPQSPLYSSPIIDFITNQSKKTGVSGMKMAILYSNSALGQACTPYAVQYAQSKGVQVLFNDPYTTGSVTDFTPYISKYQAAGVNALAGTQDPEPAILIVRAMQQLNWQPTVMAAFDGAFGSDSWIQSLGKAANDTYATAPWYFNIDAFGMKDFTKTFTKRYKAQPGSVDQIAFAGISVIADALERAASLDRSKLKTALLKTTLAAAAGPIPCLNFNGVKFSSVGVNTRASNFVGMTKGSTSYVVGPTKYATIKPVWPRPSWSSL